jgi:poly(3-hydroxybutyrate) depolymerase
MAVKISQLCIILILSIVLVSCGGGKDKSAPSGTLVSNLTLPGTSFPHQIDIYNPETATKAIVFLHGGSGRNYEFANSLGLNLRVLPPTPTSINWDWLNTNKVIAVFPQGQAIPAQPYAYTWNNHSMNSGADDVAFLQALAAYITSQYGITDIYLVGHSNGGMMANRMWCESPATFKAYISMSGPASDYYLNGATSCSPSIVKPYYGIVGGQDSVLQVPLYGWSNPKWEVAPDLVASSGAAMPDPTLIGEWWQQVNTRGPLMCGEIPSLTDYKSDGKTNTWDNCNGHLKLQEVLFSDHFISSLEFYSGKKMIDLIADFINVP